MDVILGLVLVLHLIGMSAIVGAWMCTMRTPRILPGMVHGALVQLVTGVMLVGLREAGAGDGEPDHVKISVKLLVALLVAVLAWVNRRRADEVSSGVFHAVGGLTVLNVCVAVLW